MDHNTTYLDFYTQYYTSEIVLLIDSSAACLVALKAKSRITKNFQINDHSKGAK